MTKLIAAARRLLRHRTHPTLQDVLSPEQLGKMLARERARADRTGERFAVVTFSPHGGELAEDAWGELAKVVKSRLRLTDEVGWLGAGNLCLVLGGTGTEGAHKVVKDIGEQLGGFPTLCCSIYEYPSAGSNREEVLEGGQLDGQVIQEPSIVGIGPLFERSMPLWKRCLDVAAASAGLLVLAPLFALVALTIKLTSRGPVFFLQPRSGRGGRPFLMWKFRSMVADAEGRKKELMAANEQDGAAFKMKNDPRVTRVGKILRASSIDELPQLWNVLRGDMSLVGPRPLPCGETARCVGWQLERLDFTPGLTCIWQVKGRSRVSFADWMRMDVQYNRSHSLAQDLKLLIMTVPAVLLGKGAQ